MDAIIIEDEKLAARRLEILLKKVAPEVEIKTILPSIEEAVQYLKREQPELIFLDIHLSDGSSFNIFDRVKVKSPIIFTTAYDEYALKAFKVNSIDYLLKPIEEEDLLESLKKFRDLKRANPGAVSDFDRLLAAFRNQKIRYKQRFFVSFGSKIKSIKIENSAYFYADGKAVFLVDKAGQKHVLDDTLDQLQESLDPTLFFRVNRGFIVGIDAIEQMYSYSRSRVKIILKPAASKDCVVSTDKTPDFKNWLGR